MTYEMAGPARKKKGTFQTGGLAVVRAMRASPEGFAPSGKEILAVKKTSPAQYY